MKIFLVRGLPPGLAKDAWWMAADVSRGGGAPRDEDRQSDGGMQVAILCGLIILADRLVWGILPGLSLVPLALSIAAAAQFSFRRPVSAQNLIWGWGLLLVAILPVIVQANALSISFLIFGCVHFIVRLAFGTRHPDIPALLRSGLRLPYLGLDRNVDDIIKLPNVLDRKRGLSARIRGVMGDWLIPLGLGAVFLALFALANPLIDGWVIRVTDWSLPAIGAERVFLWLGLFWIMWPALRIAVFRERLTLPGKDWPILRVPGLNSRSLLRGLVVFNILFAAQTLTDSAYLWGGVGLPDGISYAAYAHRGAYPLLGVALLAGGFALLAQRHLDGRRGLRPLLYLWLGQTVVLVVSSLLRLDLYVDAYGLTLWRVAAAIWMALVVVGLSLMFWQLWKGYSAGWLVGWSGAASLGTLYACCFVSFAGVVADHNLRHQPAHKIDRYYVCGLGPDALPAIRRWEATTGRAFCYGDRMIRETAPVPQDWREWGYRNWRLRTTLAGIETRGQGER
ncbi:DUF4173 domain-containing protein [Marivivens marinus]|uniref:DUF4153 domain-containing protein n=1 Tax=Marivivens marinus TaxID=3110173 RepID=UPI003B8469B2